MKCAGLILLFCEATRAGQAPEPKYTFTTQGTVIEMSIALPEAYVGKPLLFYTGADLSRKTCHVKEAGLQSCPERFVGAMALVTFSVHRSNGRVPKAAVIREEVNLVAQSAGLPPVNPVSVTAQVENGLASDIQLFGYDETSLSEADREVERGVWMPLWKLYRQKLYLDRQTEPFAILLWKHTTSAIFLLKVESPGFPPARSPQR